MDWAYFTNKKVGLLGAGVENLALVPHLKNAGASITICNKDHDPRLDEIKNDLELGIIIGDGYLDNLDDYDVVFRVSGMPVQVLTDKIKGERPIVTSAINLFLEICPSTIVGVTGTKGKGTTSTMIAEILRSTGRKVFVGANINVPVFSFFDQLDKESIVVLELSSFQLEDVSRSPHIAVVLPITPDHLEGISDRSPNYHQSFEHYVAAKANITKFQGPEDFLVIAIDNSATKQIAQASKAKVLSVSTKSGPIILNQQGELSAEGEVIDLAETGLRGQHMFLDAALAATASRLLGANAETIKSGLKNFQPLPHRLELIGTFAGVQVFNDSYATAPEATIAAISAFVEPVLLIAGGSTKGAEFNTLASAICLSSVASVQLIGQEATKIQSALLQANYSGQVELQPNLEAAVEAAVAAAKPGSVILLSPACASKDMFKDAADRGEQFVKCVRAAYYKKR